MEAADRVFDPFGGLHSNRFIVDGVQGIQGREQPVTICAMMIDHAPNELTHKLVHRGGIAGSRKLVDDPTISSEII